MPDNAIYYQMAYGALVVMFVAYAWSIHTRRLSIARKLRDSQQAK